MTYLTLDAVADLLSVDRDVVSAWIRSGELPAANVARPGALRKRYRIRQADVDAFVKRRAVEKPLKLASRRKAMVGAREYY